MSTPCGYHELFLLLTGQHGLVRSLLTEVRLQSGGSRQDAMDELRATLATHEAWERGWVHPLVTSTVRNGGPAPEVMTDRLIEENDTGIVLDRLATMRMSSGTFGTQFGLLAEAVEHHATAEEERELPLLAAVGGAEVEAGIGRAIWVGREVSATTARIRELTAAVSFGDALALAGSRLQEVSGIPVAS